MRAQLLTLPMLLAACGSGAHEFDAGDAFDDDASSIDAAMIDAPIDGLLVDAPTDAQLWPPTDFGFGLGAAAAGDVDGDGREDLLLVLYGGHMGLHVFRGGNVDLDDHGAVIGLPDHAPLLTIEPPLAVTMYDGLPVLARGAITGQLAVFDRDLSLYSTSLLPLPILTSNDRVVLRSVPTGPEGSLAIAALTDLYRVERATLRLNPPTLVTIAGPPEPFVEIQDLASDAGGTLVVVEPDGISLGTPTAAGEHTWVQRSFPGLPWNAVLAADVTGDGRPDAVGYRKPSGSAELCVHDGADEPVVQPSCRVMPGQNAERALLLLAELDASPGLDLIVSTMILPGVGMGLLEVYPDLRVVGAGLVSGTRHTLILPTPPGVIVAMDVDGDGDKELMMVVGDGHLRCVAVGAAGFEDC